MNLLRKLKDMSRRMRVALYVATHGGRFSHGGLPVEIPDCVAFSVKKQIMRGQYEEPECRLVRRHLDPGLPVIELGGSLGVVSALINSRLEAGTTLTVVEANPQLLHACRTNAAAAGHGERVEVVHAAVAYGSDTVSFAVSADSLSGRLGAEAGKASLEVPAVTLSQLVESRVGGRAYSLVMDIEGAEYDVFAHDAGGLSSCRMAIVEVHPHIYARSGQSLDGFMELVSRAGFEVLERDGDSLVLVHR